ncbi:MAG: ABC transporter permease [Paracoccaceae bacterium]|jgi:peptide/nickel transport system permease protein|nr:MAG: ABC transporter permease [Rhodobacter sp. BACL10 MAG-121220-bin24]KRO89351.1 MAG: ABC transporter permease [Rhodobacter sp. BACL10 MAG-120910-bin24]KRP24376.1 MAG: ABC transporter permease [Rhodobacter sp. BACL10 MAG-120419-bin15]MDO7732566.1 ABC transporter permease [Paracoccaceae bacterium]MDP5352569.1 ABC transporter permease [Paracoccaceae bacterium]
MAIQNSLKNPPISAKIGMVILVVFIFFAIFAPLIAPYGEAESIGKTWASPSAEFLLGTDNIGRDMLSRIIFGARMTLGVATACTLLSFLIGITMGLLAAVAGKALDQILSRFVDLMLSIPILVFALMILSMFGSSLFTLIITIGILDSFRVFRLARSIAINIVVTEFVEVARLRGEGLWWIMVREVLPNALPPMIAEFGLRFCFNFLFVAGLSFLGLGIQPPFADWGGMVRENGRAIAFGIPAPLWPAIAIGLTTISVNMIVDWILSINARPSGASAEM